MRPIVPCHKAIQNPAAKYVSKALKPIIKSAPTILHGTKDLAIKLSQLKLTPNCQFFIITGDVVAFYPNIDAKKCFEIAHKLHEEHLNTLDIADATDLPKDLAAKILIFSKCMTVANENLITMYDGKYYKQKRGLAMGIACAPDLANLYGFWFERILKITEHPLIPFYGRYIDDVFAIIYASSEAEAINIISQVKYDNCTIEWNASQHYQVFLDMS
jgi:hypothetical protein